MWKTRNTSLSLPEKYGTALAIGVPPICDAAFSRGSALSLKLQYVITSSVHSKVILSFEYVPYAVLFGGNSIK